MMTVNELAVVVHIRFCHVCLSAGSVSIDELIRALVPMGADPVEIEKMVKVADTDGDGEASHSNHARAN